MNNVIVDTNVIVSFIDEKDKWHNRSLELIARADSEGWKGVILDLILFEAISVISKRLNERGRLPKGSLSPTDDVSEKIDKIVEIFLKQVTWTGNMIGLWFGEIIDIVKRSNGRLNFNDAFIVVFCLKNGINFILSFDRDFDEIDFIKRIE